MLRGKERVHSTIGIRSSLINQRARSAFPFPFLYGKIGSKDKKQEAHMPTGVIFACNLGYVVSAIALPQFIIFSALFYLAGFIVPLTSPEMIADFKACGGFIMLATGFRMLQLKMFPTADMIPAMVLVMPLSWLWANIILPLL